MIDTVKFLCHLPRRAQAATGWDLRTSFKPYVDSDGYEASSEDNESGTHHRSGVRVWGTPEVIFGVECSLPRLLFGNNGRVISSQQEIQKAFTKLRKLLLELAHEPDGPLVRKFTRIDLCWQFRTDVGRFLTAHRGTPHRLIRSTQGEFHGESLTWPGKEVRIILYDKEYELHKKRGGDVIRLEFQLRGKKLNELMGNDFGIVERLDFADCYGVFRKLAMMLEPKSVPRVSQKMAHILALAEESGLEIRGVSLFDIWTAEMKPRAIRSLRTQMAAWRPDTFGIDWATLLPSDAPPEAVHVTRCGRGTRGR